MLPNECLLRLQGAVRGVAHRTGHPDRAVVAQIPPDFPHDHRDGVGRKPDIQIDIEIVDGFHQADASDLKQIIHALSPSGKALDDTENQAQISRNQLFSGLPISLG